MVKSKILTKISPPLGPAEAHKAEMEMKALRGDPGKENVIVLEPRRFPGKSELLTPQEWFNLIP